MQWAPGKLHAKSFFVKKNRLVVEFRYTKSRNAQAGTTATGGGRVKRANVLRALGSTVGGSDSRTLTIATVGAGAGV